MCGITGFLTAETIPDGIAIVSKMAKAITHRGPDDHGTWANQDAGIYFGHQRLSILDLSQEGHQPMCSASGRYVLSFNGEIYNFAELRAQLEKSGHSFRGRSDTEVMLAAFEEWGISPALEKFVGMFAFSVWDNKERRLTLARDRIGEKPLYFGWWNNNFLFGSELKAFHPFPNFSFEVNRDALALYLRYSYLPSPYCILSGFYKLPAGCFLQIEGKEGVARASDFDAFPEGDGGSFRPQRFWSAKGVVHARHTTFSGSEEDAEQEVERLLRQSVRLQMVADVPVGAFLSGGIDSSIIVALMQQESSIPARTFSIGFHEAQYNEAHYAKEVAEYLGTNHTELYVTPEDALSLIPSLPDFYDEPFADSSQIPTHLVSQLTRQQVKVSMSGDGGDELFAGYPRFLWAQRIWKYVSATPFVARSVFSAVVRTLPVSFWDSVLVVGRPFTPKSFSFKDPGEKLYRLADVIRIRKREQFYEELLSHWRNALEVVPGSRNSITTLSHPQHQLPSCSFLEWMMYADLMHYLPGDILVKVDRASMAVSLEARAPFLDHRLVEFVWSLPAHYRSRGGISKYLLRKILYRSVPQKLIERPKMGFGVPVGEWIRSPLRDWAEDLLSVKKLTSRGLLNPDPIREKWTEHLAGKRNWQYHLWSILMFQAWAERYDI